MDAIILCGGFGTRLQKIVPDVPKILAPIRKTPFLDFLLQRLFSHSLISRVILAVGYKSQQIIEHVEKNFSHLDIVFSIEEHPLGTGGALKLAETICHSDQIFALNGDTYFDVDLGAFYQFHLDKNSDFSLACLKMDDPSRYGTVAIDQKTNKVLHFLEKETCLPSKWVNGGFYLFQKGFFQTFPSSFSLEKDAFSFIAQGKMYAFCQKSIFIDIGTEDSFKNAQGMITIK